MQSERDSIKSEIQVNCFQKLIFKRLKLSKSSNINFTDTCYDVIKNYMNPEYMKSEVKLVSELYTIFSENREKLWADHLNHIKREKVLEKTKTELLDLLNKEEQLTAFEKSQEIEYNMWLAPRTLRETRWSRLKEWRHELAKLKGNASNDVNGSDVKEFG